MHAPPHRVGEGHAGADAADFFGVDVGVEGLVCWFPLEGGAEAEDGGVGAALRWNDAVPLPVVVAPDDTAMTGHVALAGENEYVLFGWVVVWIGVGFHCLGFQQTAACYVTCQFCGFCAIESNLNPK